MNPDPTKLSKSWIIIALLIVIFLIAIYLKSEPKSEPRVLYISPPVKVDAIDTSPRPCLNSEGVIVKCKG